VCRRIAECRQVSVTSWAGSKKLGRVGSTLAAGTCRAHARRPTLHPGPSQLGRGRRDGSPKRPAARSATRSRPADRPGRPVLRQERGRSRARRPRRVRPRSTVQAGTDPGRPGPGARPHRSGRPRRPSAGGPISGPRADTPRPCAHPARRRPGRHGLQSRHGWRAGPCGTCLYSEGGTCGRCPAKGTGTGIEGPGQDRAGFGERLMQDPEPLAGPSTVVVSAAAPCGSG
jgi:hypothetical protein